VDDGGGGDAGADPDELDPFVVVPFVVVRGLATKSALKFNISGEGGGYPRVFS
jgi:hypothetical protein